jgi:DNA end-binding protein Ku
MASKKKQRRKSNGEKAAGGRAIWKGAISFGLVSIPVALHSAETANALDFDLLDKRDFAPIRYKRFNEQTGEEVSWDQIIKGYEYKKGEYVTLTDDDFVRANVKATQSIDIADFVDANEISPIYYDKPYYVSPLKNGRHAYFLLHQVLKRTGKVAIARVVIRTRQHLAAVMPEDSILVLNLLRFHDELRDPRQLEIPQGGKEASISTGEIKMAERLIESMVGGWRPEKYRDEYREDLLKLIDKKISSGKPRSIESGSKPRPPSQGKVVDIMSLLRRSVEEAQKKEPPAKRRKAG